MQLYVMGRQKKRRVFDNKELLLSMFCVRRHVQNLTTRRGHDLDMMVECTHSLTHDIS